MLLFFLKDVLIVGKNSLHLYLGFLVRNTPSEIGAECGGSSFWARNKNNLFLSILDIIESWHFCLLLTHTDNAEVAKCQSELKDEVTHLRPLSSLARILQLYL